MKLKGDQSTTRALNRRLVLNCLRREGEMSRVNISGVTGLSQAAISAVVGELIEEGFVIEGKGGQSGGGRRPVPLSIDYGRRYSVGLKLMRDRLDATLTDLSTAPVATCTVKLPEHTPEATIKAAEEAVMKLIPEEHERQDRLVGVGLAMPGLIDVERGVCLISQRFGWKNVPIAALLADRINVPVWVDNDVNAFAIAQQLFGHGRRRSSVLVLIVGTGVGAALVFNGQIHRGARFAAGEIGFPVVDATAEVASPDRLAWQRRLSEPAIVEGWCEIRRSGASDAAADLQLATETGDTRAIEYLGRIGGEIGLQLVNMIDLVDPEVVIVGGEAIRFGPALVGPLMAAVATYCFETPPPVEIDWENNVWSRGASALAIQQFFDFESTAGIASKRSMVSTRPQKFLG